MSTLEKTIQGREAIVALAIIGLITIAALFVSCGTGHVSCDAYGQNNIEYGDQIVTGKQ